MRVCRREFPASLRLGHSSAKMDGNSTETALFFQRRRIGLRLFAEFWPGAVFYRKLSESSKSRSEYAGRFHHRRHRDRARGGRHCDRAGQRASRARDPRRGVCARVGRNGRPQADLWPRGRCRGRGDRRGHGRLSARAAHLYARGRRRDSVPWRFGRRAPRACPRAGAGRAPGRARRVHEAGVSQRPDRLKLRRGGHAARRRELRGRGKGVGPAARGRRLRLCARNFGAHPRPAVAHRGQHGLSRGDRRGRRRGTGLCGRARRSSPSCAAGRIPMPRACCARGRASCSPGGRTSANRR